MFFIICVSLCILFYFFICKYKFIMYYYYQHLTVCQFKRGPWIGPHTFTRVKMLHYIECTKEMKANSENKRNKQTDKRTEKKRSRLWRMFVKETAIETERRNMAPIGIYCNSSRYFLLLFVICYPSVEYYHHSNHFVWALSVWVVGGWMVGWHSCARFWLQLLTLMIVYTKLFFIQPNTHTHTYMYNYFVAWITLKALSFSISAVADCIHFHCFRR